MLVKGASFEIDFKTYIQTGNWFNNIDVFHLVNLLTFRSDLTVLKCKNDQIDHYSDVIMSTMAS